MLESRIKRKAGPLSSHQCRYNHKDINLLTPLQYWNIKRFNFGATLIQTDLRVIIIPFPQTVIVPIKLYFKLCYRLTAGHCFL